MAKQQFDTLKSIRLQMLDQANILEDCFQARIKKQHKERELEMNNQFRKKMKKLGFNLRNGIGEIKFKDFRLTVDMHGRLIAVKKCERCEKEIKSNQLLTMDNFSSFITGRYWAYHCCVPKGESEKPPTVEQLVYNKFEEIFDLIWHDHER